MIGWDGERGRGNKMEMQRERGGWDREIKKGKGQDQNRMADMLRRGESENGEANREEKQWTSISPRELVNQFIIKELSTVIFVRLVGENVRLWESIESHPMARDFIGRLGCDEWCSSVGSSFTGNSYFLRVQETDFHLLWNVCTFRRRQFELDSQWMHSSLNQNKL